VTFTRVNIIIIDACGVGELPDAADYGDQGAATLPHVAQANGGLSMPVCENLGLGNIVSIGGIPPTSEPLAAYGKMAERSPGKDSTLGHWEIGGVIVDRPLPLFPQGFPPELVERFERAAGIETIGNLAASGTEIIARLGEEHLATLKPILYTSADSVFQLAAHEDVFRLPRLYEICEVARELLMGDFGVGRVIARPFAGPPGKFFRTHGRRDFSLAPPAKTFLDLLAEVNRATLAIGKVDDLYAHRGITTAHKATNNAEVMAAVRQTIRYDYEHDLVFSNCVDFDQLWGHRNDERGFARGLEDFDISLGQVLPHLRKNDLLIITADHGCDPTLKCSTDHTREYVPLLVCGSGVAPGRNLGTRKTFADIAATVAEIFELPAIFPGTSFLQEILK
jgi:phosphopentomutase